MKLIAFHLSNNGIKKYKFYAEECPRGQLGLLLFKVNRERGNLTPESYFNKNLAGKAKSGNENMYFLGVIIAIINLFDWHVKAT